ncbi:MAG: TetR/AcrR family transcriptional regulator [Solirubrobacteraceae bacterium]
MGRRAQPERQAALLADCTDELLRHRLPGLTLAKMATAAGTSSRMLLYHFNTRDQLVLQALGEARRRQQQGFGELLTPRPGVPYATVLTEAWDRITAPDLRPYLRLFGQLHDPPSQRTPWTEFRARSITDWLPTIEAGLRADGRSDAVALSTAVNAVIRGLLQDLNATADHQRTTDGLRAIAKLLILQPR